METQEKILLFEDKDRIRQIEEIIERDLARVRRMVETYRGMGIFPELSDLNELEKFRGRKPQHIEAAIRAFLVDQSGTNLNGVTLAREAVEKMIELPQPETEQFINACGLAFSHQSFDLGYFMLKGNTAVVNDHVVEAKKERFRAYAKSDEQLQRLTELTQFADVVNAMSEKYGKGFFAGKKIPLLENRIRAERTPDKLSTTGKYFGKFVPNWRFVAHGLDDENPVSSIPAWKY